MLKIDHKTYHNFTAILAFSSALESNSKRYDLMIYIYAKNEQKFQVKVYQLRNMVTEIFSSL